MFSGAQQWKWIIWWEEIKTITRASEPTLHELFQLKMFPMNQKVFHHFSSNRFSGENASKFRAWNEASSSIESSRKQVMVVDDLLHSSHPRALFFSPRGAWTHARQWQIEFARLFAVRINIELICFPRSRPYRHWFNWCLHFFGIELKMMENKWRRSARQIAQQNNNEK